MHLDTAHDASMMTQMTSLHEARLDHVYRQLKATGARSVLDLGCGSGALLYRLASDDQFERIVGLEASGLSLRQARLDLAQWIEPGGDRVRLVPGSYTQSQPQLAGFDAAAMVETIEHVKPEHIGLVEKEVFSHMRPGAVYVTTPNREYNPLYGLAPGEFREADHKFEWDRARFYKWATGVAQRNGYTVSIGGMGEADIEFGHPTQTALFRCLD